MYIRLLHGRICLRSVEISKWRPPRSVPSNDFNSLGNAIEEILADSDSEVREFGGKSDTLDSESSSDIESESSRQELGFRG